MDFHQVVYPICSVFVAAPTLSILARISYFKSRDLSLSLMVIKDFLLQDLQYRARALQHLHAHKLRATWRISTKNPCKKLACKFLHELLPVDFLHPNLSVFLR